MGTLMICFIFSNKNMKFECSKIYPDCLNLNKANDLNDA